MRPSIIPKEWHPSNVNRAKQCQRAALYDQIASEEVAVGEGVPVPPTYEMFRGTATHLVLEFAAAQGGELHTALRINELAPWEGHPDFSTISDERMSDIMDDCEQFIRNYYKLEDMSRVDIEATELTLSSTIGGVPFVGTIDRVDRVGDTAVRIVDYKTGSFKNVDAWRQDARRQICMYAMAYEHMFPYSVVVEGTIYWLGETSAEENVTITKSKILQAKSQLQETYIDILLGRDEPNPGPLCGWCSHVLDCPEGATVVRNRIEKGLKVSSMHRMAFDTIDNGLDYIE
ncbi:MAG: PD-(D/E)XK nuclease family protein [Gammaproteobacteria bacterium]|nr:PD-(D/E)XK nuclease family protein [Gammaproteobacteria bacterium]